MGGLCLEKAIGDGVEVAAADVGLSGGEPCFVGDVWIASHLTDIFGEGIVLCCGFAGVVECACAEFLHALGCEVKLDLIGSLCVSELAEQWIDGATATQQAFQKPGLLVAEGEGCIAHVGLPLGIDSPRGFDAVVGAGVACVGVVCTVWAALDGEFPVDIPELSTNAQGASGDASGEVLSVGDGLDGLVICDSRW